MNLFSHRPLPYSGSPTEELTAEEDKEEEDADEAEDADEEDDMASLFIY